MTLVQVRVPDPSTKPGGIPRVPAVAPTWRPERGVADRLFALAAQLDGDDPLFDDIAGLMATSLLLAGGELDVIERRRALATGQPFREVALRGEWGAHRVVYTVRAQSRGPQ